MEKATNIIMQKGYDRITAENMAVNCFCAAQQFNESVEYWVSRIEETYKPRIAQ